MIRSLLLSLLAAAILGSSGCLFWRKPDRPRKDGSIVSEVETNLKRRWIDQRVAQLVARGVAQDAALRQATDEFREKFEFTGAAKQ